MLAQLLLLRPRKKPQTLLELTRSRRCKVRLLMLRPLTPLSAPCLPSALGNGGLGLGGMKVFRHGHQSSSMGDPNPHGEGLSFFKDSNRGGGYYRMKMSICASAFESDACMQVFQVISIFFLMLFIHNHSDGSRYVDDSIVRVSFNRLLHARREKHGIVCKSCRKNFLLRTWHF
jgi:hypothetical protein